MLADGVAVGRIMKVHAAPVGSPWMWTLAFGYSPGPHADARLRGDARGCDGGVRQELATGIGAALPLARPLALIPAWGLSRLTEARQNGCRAFLGVTPLVTLESKRPAFMAKTG